MFYVRGIKVGQFSEEATYVIIGASRGHVFEHHRRYLSHLPVGMTTAVTKVTMEPNKRPHPDLGIYMYNIYVVTSGRLCRILLHGCHKQYDVMNVGVWLVL